MTLSSRRVLVTGAAGFIGAHLAARLLARGDEVLGLDSLTEYYDAGLKKARLERLQADPRFSFERRDLAHSGLTEVFLSFAPDLVVHLAAQAGVRHSLDSPHAYTSANVEGFLNVLEACRAYPVAHLIYASSSSVYGANTKLPFSEDHRVDDPVSLYAVTKRTNELMAHTYAHLFGIPCTGLRFFTVYGPFGRPDMAYFKFTKAIIDGRPIEVYNHGRLRRDFTYIDDVTEAMLRLLEHIPQPQQCGTPHRIYNIGNHTPVELGRFIEIIEEATGRAADKRFLPMQPGDVVATYADVSRLADAVGFAPSTPLEDGIAAFVAWYRDFYGAS